MGRRPPSEMVVGRASDLVVGSPGLSVGFRPRGPEARRSVGRASDLVGLEAQGLRSGFDPRGRKLRSLCNKFVAEAASANLSRVQPLQIRSRDASANRSEVASAN
ncbi:hypothetical protein OIU85_007952 [Salix viminalis]|uniref:Uncharacterized protein n=1 Tax=Salix viminalis TaxID=40686 RepID=A0A9Q0PAP5_SALVM|nr:hypothetical protein OIU85_007952 [Salix viminalis]